MAIKGLYICVTWDEIEEKVLIDQNVLSSQKIERVLLGKNILSSQKTMREIPKELHCQMFSKKEILGQTLAKSIRIFT